MLSLRSHITTSSTLLCLPSRFHKKLFSLKLLFSLGTIHLCQPHGRKGAGVGTWNLSRACGFYCFYTTYMLFYFADGRGFSQNWFFVDVTHVWRFTQPDSGCSFFFPYFSPILEFEVHGGSNHKNIDRSCITNEQCE